MSVQGDIESALETMIEGAISGLVAETGTRTQPEIEGDARAAIIRRTAGSGERLDYGQTRWSESFLVTVWWRSSVGRSTRIDEWEAFAAALLADQYLGGSIAGLEDAYLSETTWGEVSDGPFVTMVAEVTAVRIE